MATTMNCCLSSRNNNEDCVEAALDTIRKHYAFYREAVQTLKVRNRRFMKAIELLQTNKSRSAESSVSKKRRKTDSPEAASCSQADVGDASAEIDATTPLSQLNVALNSEQLLLLDELAPASPGQSENDVGAGLVKSDITFCADVNSSTPIAADSIAESKHNIKRSRSPRLKLERVLLYEDESEKTLDYSPTKKLKRSTTLGVVDGHKLETSGQVQLGLNVSAVDQALPMPDSCSVVELPPPPQHIIILDESDNESDADKNCIPAQRCKNDSPSSVSRKPVAPDATISAPAKRAAKIKHELKGLTADIFLDDTADEVELLAGQHYLKSERNNQKKLRLPKRRTVSKTDKANVQTAQVRQETDVRVATAVCTTATDTDETDCDELETHLPLRPVLVKQEAISDSDFPEKPVKATEAIDNEDSDDEFMPLPIPVKLERRDIPDGDFPETPAKPTEATDNDDSDDEYMPLPIAVKPERLDTPDNDELRTQMQPPAVPAEDHSLHQALTPEGFWDPFIRSFHPNDPRNEVLIDNRFLAQSDSRKKGN